MPTVEFDFVELTEMLGREFTPGDLKDKIPMLGVDLAEIDCEKIILEVFPNRPDLLCVEGFSRALKGFLGIETGFIDYQVRDSGMKLSADSSVMNVRPCIAAGVVRNVDITEKQLKSLMDLQEKLHVTHGRNRKKVAIGVHDLERVEPPFIYKAVMPENISFVPLDMDKEMNLKQILKKHPKGRDYAYTLENLDMYPVILDVKGSVLSFPPVINGELTRVTQDSKNLFIEVTGQDQKAVDQALNIVITSIADRGGGVCSVDIEYMFRN